MARQQGHSTAARGQHGSLGSSVHPCRTCVHVEELLLMTELQEEVGRLRSIREYEREIDHWNSRPSMQTRPTSEGHLQSPWGSG